MISCLVSGNMGDVDIDTLTFEEYLALKRKEQGSGLVRPAIGAEVQFEIKNQFIWGLRKDPFSGAKTEDAHEHIENVLYIVSLFNNPGVSHYAIMLRVFSMTLPVLQKDGLIGCLLEPLILGRY